MAEYRKQNLEKIKAIFNGLAYLYLIYAPSFGCHNGLQLVKKFQTSFYEIIFSKK
jgi:hypothetical protein